MKAQTSIDNRAPFGIYLATTPLSAVTSPTSMKELHFMLGDNSSRSSMTAAL